MPDLCCDYIQKYSRPIGFLYFYQPINIILSADWSNYIKDITRRLPESVPKLYNRPIVGRRSADTPADDRPTYQPMICGPFKYDISRLIGRPSADHRPIAKTPKLSADGKNYKKVVIIYFFVGRYKKSLNLAFYRLINRPINRLTVGGVNVIAVLSSFSIGRQKIKL